MKSIIPQPYTIKAYWVLPYCQQLPLATDIVNHACIAVHQCNTHTLTWVSITCRWIITSSFIWPSSVPYLPNNSRPFLTSVLFAKLPQEMLHPLSWVPGACNHWKRSVSLISVFLNLMIVVTSFTPPAHVRHIPYWSSGRWLDVWITTGCWLVGPMVIGFDWMNEWLGLDVIWCSSQDLVSE